MHMRRGSHLARSGSPVRAAQQVEAELADGGTSSAAGSRGSLATARGRPSQAPQGSQARHPGQGGQARLGEVARGSTLNLLGAVVSAVTTVGVTVFVTRHFSRVETGVFFSATSAFIIIQTVASLGANVGLVYFIARLRSLGLERRIPAIMRTALIPVIVASLVATALMLGLAEPLARVLLSGHIGRGGANKGAVADTLRLLGLSVPFATLLNTCLGASRGYRDMRSTVFVDRIGRSTVQLLGVIVAALIGSSALLAPLWALPYIPAAAIAWLWLRHTQRHPKRRRPDLPDPDVPPELAALLALSTPVLPAGAKGARPQVGGRMARRRLANANPGGFWRFTTPRALANLASVTLQRIDIVLVAIMRGPVDAAIYTAATRFLVVGQFGNVAISMSAQPRLTELFAVGDIRNANEVYQVTTAWLVLLTWPLYLLAVIFGPQVLAIFGHSYRAGGNVMVLLGLTMLLAMACGQVDVLLITTGRSSWSLINGLLAVFVNVGVDLALIPRYGIFGAAVGWAVAILVTNLMPLAQLAVVLKLNPFGRATLAACALCTVSFCVVPLLARAALSEPAGPALGLTAGGAIYLAGLLRFREALRLEAMPGMSFLQRRRARR